MSGNLPSISLKLRQVVNRHLESVAAQSCLASLLLLVLVFQQGAEGFKFPNQSALSGLLVSAVLNSAGFGPLRSTLGRSHKSHMPY